MDIESNRLFTKQSSFPKCLTVLNFIIHAIVYGFLGMCCLPKVAPNQQFRIFTYKRYKDL